MILTYLNSDCHRQHDYPVGWPAHAIITCWACDTIHLAERTSELRLATPEEVAQLKKMPAQRMQSQIAAWMRQAFAGRTGIIPASEYIAEAKCAAKALNIETVTASGGMGVLADAVKINKHSGEMRAATIASEPDEDEGEVVEFCLDHGQLQPFLLRLMGSRGAAQNELMRAGSPHHIPPAQDLYDLLSVAATVAVGCRRQELDEAAHIELMTDIFRRLLVRKAEEWKDRERKAG